MKKDQAMESSFKEPLYGRIFDMCNMTCLLVILLGIFLPTSCFSVSQNVVFFKPSMGEVYVNISNITGSPSRQWIIQEDPTALKKINFVKLKLPCHLTQTEFSLKVCNEFEAKNNCLNFCNPDQSREVSLKGRIQITMKWSFNEITLNNYEFLFKYEYQCNTPCQESVTLNPDLSKIIKPKPLQYHNCRCEWNVFIPNDKYIIKAEFISILLARSNSGRCLDEVFLIDLDDDKTSGPYCGYIIPKPVKTSENNLRVIYTTRNIHPADKFELLISSEKKEDLAGLQSVAAVLGAISFGIFIGLMLCSVLYKRWSRGRPDNELRAEEGGNRYDDYDDAIQRAAPPSYNKVLAAPEDYPSTPNASPILTRTLPTVNPPEYPGANDTPQIQQAQAGATLIEVDPTRETGPEMELIDIPLPNYDIVSESEDEWFSVNQGARSPGKTRLVGWNGLPPSYEAVTSEGSDAEVEANRRNRRSRNRTSRSKRTSSSKIRNAQRTNAQASNAVQSDSDSDNEENKGRESQSKRANLENSVDLSVINSDSEGEIEEAEPTAAATNNDRSTSPNLLTIPEVSAVGSIRATSNYAPVVRSRSYTDLARHAIHNSIGRNERPVSPTIPYARPRANSWSERRSLAQHPMSYGSFNSFISNRNFLEVPDDLQASVPVDV